jgi:DNA modification methylase
MVELTLHHGDCLEIMKEIAANSIDLIICDLPYGCLTNGGDLHKKCSWDVKIDLELFWKEIKRIRKNENSPCIHFCTTKFGYDLIKSNPAEFRYDLVWDKMRGVSFLTSGKMPMRSHEMIYVFSKAGAYYHRVDEDAPGKVTKRFKQDGTKLSDSVSDAFRPTSGVISPTIEDGKKCVVSVIQLDKKTQGGRNKHPTEKPPALYKWLIERYCPEGGTVLDPTFGSGNSVFTAYNMGRNAIGIEKDEAFYEKAAARM